MNMYQNHRKARYAPRFLGIGFCLIRRVFYAPVSACILVACESLWVARWEGGSKGVEKMRAKSVGKSCATHVGGRPNPQGTREKTPFHRELLPRDELGSGMAIRLPPEAVPALRPHVPCTARPAQFPRRLAPSADRLTPCRHLASQMQIFGRSIEGSTLAIELRAGASAGEACAALCAKEGVDAAAVRLVYQGKQLDAETSLAMAGVEAGSTVHMLPRMVGGVIEPSLVVLAKKFNTEKKVCRLCYARLPVRAINCRKKICGHTNQLRPKKKLK